MSDAFNTDPGPRVQPEPGPGPQGPVHKQLSPEAKATWARLFPMIVVAVLMGLAQTVLNLMALIQFIVLLTSKRQPNAQIAEFGATLGDWQARSARFLTAQTEDKPWPWSPLA